MFELEVAILTVHIVHVELPASVQLLDAHNLRQRPVIRFVHPDGQTASFSEGGLEKGQNH